MLLKFLCSKTGPLALGIFTVKQILNIWRNEFINFYYILNRIYKILIFMIIWLFLDIFLFIMSTLKF